jgi:hypothetical protein
VHDGLVSEDPSQFRARQRSQNRNRIRNNGSKPCSLRLTAVRSLQYETHFMGPYPVSRFLEARDSLARAPSKTK